MLIITTTLLYSFELIFLIYPCTQVLNVILFMSLFEAVAILPSVQVKSMTSHRLIEPTFNLEDKICKKHERLLDVYCRTDHVCVCSACAESAHKSHDIVSTDHEWKKKMVRHPFENAIQCTSFPGWFVLGIYAANQSLSDLQHFRGVKLHPY